MEGKDRKKIIALASIAHTRHADGQQSIGRTHIWCATARCTVRTTIGGLPPPLERSNTIRMFIIKQEYVFGTVGSDKMVVQFIVCVD